MPCNASCISQTVAVLALGILRRAALHTTCSKRQVSACVLSQAADNAWTKAINIDASNASAWSNRGTVRLQNRQWQEGRADLQQALSLESADGKQPSALVLNQLGNADVAVGELDAACQHYEQAAQQSSEVAEIAQANLALTQCQRKVRTAAMLSMHLTQLPCGYEDSCRQVMWCI